MRPHEGLNVFASQIRQAAEAAPRESLPEIKRLLWSALGAGSVTEDEAESLSTFMDARTGSRVHGTASPALSAPRKRVGSRPRSDASMERRRRWAAAGRLPPQLAARFTLAEVAALAVVTMETVKRGDCRMHLDHIAAVAGVSRSTVKAALRRARELGFVTVTERRSSAWRNLANVVRIVSREWMAWSRLARPANGPGGGVKFSTTTDTRSPNEHRQRAPGTIQETFGMASGRRVSEPARC